MQQKSKNLGTFNPRKNGQIIDKKSQNKSDKHHILRRELFLEQFSNWKFEMREIISVCRQDNFDNQITLKFSDFAEAKEVRDLLFLYGIRNQHDRRYPRGVSQIIEDYSPKNKRLFILSNSLRMNMTQL